MLLLAANSYQMVLGVDAPTNPLQNRLKLPLRLDQYKMGLRKRRVKPRRTVSHPYIKHGSRPDTSLRHAMKKARVTARGRTYNFQLIAQAREKRFQELVRSLRNPAR